MDSPKFSKFEEAEFAAVDSPKYNKFEIFKVPYKVVNGHDIDAYILLPRKIPPGKHPIMANIHGGFMITGSALYPEWFPQWLLDYCLFHSAIIVAAEYRLLPESSGSDILDDMRDFWNWLRKEFLHELTKLKSGIEADLTKVAVEGASAGGCLAVLSGFNQPLGFIKAVIAAYPGLIPSEKKEKAMLGAPTIPVEFLEEFLKNMKPGEIVTSADPPARMKIALALTQQHERKAEIWGSDENLYPFKVLERTQDAPYMMILHGADDTAVSVNNSARFAELAKKKLGDNKIDLIIQPGEHGFDAELAGDTPWLKEALVKVTEVWLGKAGS